MLVITKHGESRLTMSKRLLLITTLFLLAASAMSMTLADSDCDFSYSNYARAVQLHDAGDYNRALYHYDCALQNDPDNTIIPLLIANVYEDIDNAGTAWSSAPTDTPALTPPPASAAPNEPFIPDWLTPYEMMPSESEPAPLQPIAVFSEQSRLIQQTDTTLIIADDEAVTYWRRLETLYIEKLVVTIKTGETTLTLYAQRGVALSVEARLTIALVPPAPLQQSVAANVSPGDPETGLDVDDYVRFASWFGKRGDWERAALALTKALELEPYRQDLRCQLGIVYESLGNQTAALAAFDYVLSQDPADICANEHRRALLRSLNAAAAPSAPATPALVSPAQDTYAQGLNFYGEGKLYAAAHSFLVALEIDPAHVDARCQLGTVFANWSNFGRAIDEFAHILAEHPQNDCALQHRKTAVIKMLSMYVPLTADDFFYHARTFTQIEEWELARDAYETGLALDQRRTDVRCALGTLYDKLGDHRAALLEFERVLTQNAVDACAWSNREALMQRLRDG